MTNDSKGQMNAEFNRQIGIRLKAARMHRDFSLKDLAATGLHEFKQYESGQTSIPLEELRQFATIVDVPIFYLLGDEELLHWFDERKFVMTYRVLDPKARLKVQNLVLAIAGDIPVTYR